MSKFLRDRGREREWSFYYFHIFANIWPTSIRYSWQARRPGSLSLSLGCCQLTAFQFVVPSWLALHLFNFDGVVCGFCPGLSLSYLHPAFLTSFFCLFFVRWLRQKLQQKFWGRFIGSFLLQLALHLKCPMVGHKLLKPGQCSTSTKMQPRASQKVNSYCFSIYWNFWPRYNLWQKDWDEDKVHRANFVWRGKIN